MHTLINEEAYFLVDGHWIHECLLDFILGYKEEKNYGYN